MTQIIHKLSEILPRYQAIFCDIWGVVHDGIKPYHSAVEALMQARLEGKYVSLVSNSPRTEKDVIRQLERIGVPSRAYDDVATAGEAMQIALFSSSFRSFFLIGREEDRPLLHELPNGVSNSMRETSVNEADCILLADLVDERPNPEDYEIELRIAATRKLPMFCANPDIMVDKGAKRIWCAGAIAEKYQNLGGGPIYHFGKPFPPIYELARQKMTAKLGKLLSPTDVVFIGDGISTDVKGAMLEDMDALFVSGGLAALETGTNREEHEADPDPDALTRFLESSELDPHFTIGQLR